MPQSGPPIGCLAMVLPDQSRNKDPKHLYTVGKKGRRTANHPTVTGMTRTNIQFDGGSRGTPAYTRPKTISEQLLKTQHFTDQSWLLQGMTTSG